MSRLAYVLLSFFWIPQLFNSAFASNKSDVDHAIKEALAILKPVELNQCPHFFQPKDKTDPEIRALIKAESSLRKVLFEEGSSTTKTAYDSLELSGDFENFNLITNEFEQVLFKKDNVDSKSRVLNIRFDRSDKFGCIKMLGIQKNAFTPPAGDCRNRISVNSEAYIQTKKENNLNQDEITYVGNLKLIRLNQGVLFSAFYDGLDEKSELMAIGISCLKKVKSTPAPNSSLDTNALVKNQKAILPKPVAPKSSLNELGKVLQKVVPAANQEFSCGLLFEQLYLKITEGDFVSLGAKAISEGVSQGAHKKFNISLLRQKKYGSVARKCGFDGIKRIDQQLYWEPDGEILYDLPRAISKTGYCTRYNKLKNGLFSNGVYSTALEKFVSELKWEKLEWLEGIPEDPDARVEGLVIRELYRQEEIRENHCKMHMNYRYLDVPLAKDRYLPFFGPTADQVTQGNELRKQMMDIRDQAFIEVNDRFGLFFYHTGLKKNKYDIVPPYEIGSDKQISGWGVVIYDGINFVP